MIYIEMYTVNDSNFTLNKQTLLSLYAFVRIATPMYTSDLRHVLVLVHARVYSMWVEQFASLLFTE